MQRLCWVAAALLLVARARGQESANRVEVVSPKENGIIATGINDRGDVIGFEWIESKEHPGVVEQVPFFAHEKAMTYLPLLVGYTATFPAAVSDDGVVAGRVSKPAPPRVAVPLRNQAFAWDAATGIRGLGTLPDDSASLATGISRNGRRISGYSVGINRIRACYWDRTADGWKVAPLPHESGLASTTVAISGDGKSMAAVDGRVPCLWTETAPGQWSRSVIGKPASIIPRAVNNSGTVAGVHFLNDGTSRAVICARGGEFEEPALPEGYVTAEASAINNDGAVVGIVDGPGGSKIGPNAFLYEKGRLRLIREAGDALTSATAINDRRQVAGVFEKDEEPEPRKPR